jgi:23S rRNA pseudouridine1911/1915/1917 synthase
MDRLRRFKGTLSFMAIVTKRIEVGADLAGRADRVVQKLTGLSRSELRGLFDHDCVSINGELCTAIGAPVKAGDVLEARYDIHTRYHPRERAWEDDAFKIIFEDKHLIVVDKSAGVLTVPAHPSDSNTLVGAISRYLAHRGQVPRRQSGQSRQAKQRGGAQLVHRLDRGASGLLVFGKDRDTAKLLQSQFEERKPEREYLAIVSGEIPKRGTFESYLATSPSLQQYSTKDKTDAQLAITHFELIRIIHGASLVRVWLETGRRNQIRVHFAESGHPVLGDPRYRPDLSSHPHWRAKRLALHAAKLGFRHPVTGKPLRFESPAPKAMNAFTH